MKRIKTKYLIPILFLLILVIVGSVAGYAIAKYRTDVVMTDAVTVRTQLADSFRLQTVRGVGSAETEEPADGNAYLIPGTTLGLRLSLEGKTAIRSYLYVEITGSVDDALLNGSWRRLDGVTGRHGGAVYAYDRVLDGAEKDLDVDVFRSGLTADPELSEDEPLSFCGYLLQITTEATRGEDQARLTFVNKFPQE